MTGEKDSLPPMNKLVLETIIDGLESSKQALTETQKQVNSMDKALTLFGSRQEGMQKNVEQLLKIIRDGNGKASLMDRVSNLETCQKINDTFITEQKTAKKEKTQESWKLWIAMITGSFGLIGVVITAVAKIFWG